MESSLEYPLSTRCLLLRLFKGGGSFGRNRKNRVPLSQQLARAESLPAKCPYEPVDGTSRVLPCQMSIWTSSWHEQSPSLLNTHMNQQMERAESFPAKCPYEPADGSSKVPPCQIPIWTSRWNEQSPSLPNDHKHVEQMCLFFFFFYISSPRSLAMMKSPYEWKMSRSMLRGFFCLFKMHIVVYMEFTLMN